MTILRNCDSCAIDRLIMTANIPKNISDIIVEYLFVETIKIHDNHYICLNCDENVRNIMLICDTPFYACPVLNCKREIYVDM